MKQIMKCAVVIGGLVATAFADETEYYCATSKWFSVETEKIQLPSTNVEVEGAGIWTAVPDSSVARNAGKIELDTDYVAPLSFQPIATYETLVRLTSQIKLMACDALQTIADKKTAICVAPDEEDGGKFKWHVWNGSEWIAGGTVAEEDIGSEFTVTLEADVANKKIRYTAEKVGGTTTWNSDLIDCARLTNQISGISYYGSTTVGDFSGCGIRKVKLEPGVHPENIEVVVIQGRPGSGIVVKKEWMSTHNVELADMNETPTDGNGLTYLQSYVLGLNPTAPMSKPFVTAVQNSETDTIAFNLGVNVNPSSGARVKYRVNAFSDSAGTQSIGQPSALRPAGESVVMDLPTSGAATRYYRVEVTIE